MIPGPANRASTGHERVLIVEDDAAIRELLYTRLVIAGYRSQHVSSGWAAVQAMQDFRPDGVILDINMPGLDGFGVLEAKWERASPI